MPGWERHTPMPRRSSGGSAGSSPAVSSAAEEMKPISSEKHRDFA